MKPNALLEKITAQLNEGAQGDDVAQSLKELKQLYDKDIQMHN